MKTKIVIWRVYVVFLMLLFVCVFIVFKVFAIQASPTYGGVVKERKADVQIRKITPIRGSIFADNGKLLVASDPVYNLFWDAKVVDDALFNDKLDSLAFGLSQIIASKNRAQWKSYLIRGKEGAKRYYKIGRNISRRDLKRIKLLPVFGLSQYGGGLIIEQEDKRETQFGILAQRVIGYTRKNDSTALDEGKVGIENAFDSHLRGVVGQREMRRLGTGEFVPATDQFLVKPQDGQDVLTTLDVNFQDVAETELMRQLKLQGAANGCVVLMEVSTGRIKAMANLEKGKDGRYYESYNHAIGSRTEPGSTFKLASLMVGLEDGAFDITDMVDTEDGTKEYYDQVMRDSKVGGYGVISIKDAFASSSNVGFSKMITENYGRNPQKYVDGIKRLMGFSTGFAVKGEKKPNIKNASDDLWSGVSLPWTSIGYETEFTPLQILTFYNAVANNGVVVRPQIVKEICQNGKVMETFDVEIINPRLCSRATIRKARECMEAVVEYGTGKSLRLSEGAGFKIAGKTGTTQVAKGISGYKTGEKVKYQASFCGYFPANEPRYSCIVVVAAPNKGKYGAEVAGTVFKAIAKKVFAADFKHHKALNDASFVEEKSAPITKPGHSGETLYVISDLDVPVKKDQDAGDWIQLESQSGYIHVKNKFVGKTTVPNVKGMGLKDALYLLENSGLLVRIKGTGRVVKQSLAAGKTFKKNDSIVLTLK